MKRRKIEKKEKNVNTFSEKEIDMGKKLHSMSLLKFIRWDQLQEDSRVEFIISAIEKEQK